LRLHAGRAAAAAVLSLSLSGPASAFDDRTLDLYNANTGESLKVTFKRGGRFDQQGLEKLNWFLRDWRRNEPTRMDPRLFDTVWEVYQKSGSRSPIQVHSGFRSRTTNAMLRRRSSAVAEHSQHTLGKAMDFHIPDVPTATLRTIALQMQDGGVGFYPRANSPFVHVDVGSVRHWPRMTRQQLARIFPDGKTVHIPSDGKPMPGYEVARAAIDSGRSIDTASAGPNFLERLFGIGRAPAPQAEARVEFAEAVKAIRSGASGPKAAPTRADRAEPAVAEAPLPPRHPLKEIALAANESPLPAASSSNVSGRASMDALFAAEEIEGRKLPRTVLGYAALPLNAFLPRPHAVRQAISPARPVAAPKPAAAPQVQAPAEVSIVTMDLWTHDKRPATADAGDLVLVPQMAPPQVFTPSDSLPEPRPMKLAHGDRPDGTWYGDEPSRRFSPLAWVFRR